VETSPQEIVPRDLAPREHFVQFYHQDQSLINSLTTFVAAGLLHGESVIVVATDEHRAALERELQAAGVGATAAAAQRRFLSLDAAETLDRFMVNRAPDRKRFFDTVDPIMAEARAAGTAVRAFGEMVALLWAQGNPIAALELEDLWNELGRSYVFRLFCAYPATDFTGANAGLSWVNVCKCHSRVLL
jgi:MEDS: MEthanogen/methylotroph, DcmR Sensory domain